MASSVGARGTWLSGVTVVGGWQSVRRLQPCHLLVVLAVGFILLLVAFRPFDLLTENGAAGDDFRSKRPVPVAPIRRPPPQPPPPPAPPPAPAPPPIIDPRRTLLSTPGTVPSLTLTAGHSDGPLPITATAISAPSDLRERLRRTHPSDPPPSPAPSPADVSRRSSSLCSTGGGGGGVNCCRVRWTNETIECRPLQLYWYDPLPHIEWMGLEPARNYYTIFIEFLRTNVTRTADPSAADYFILPINLIFWQSANRPPPINDSSLVHLRTASRYGQKHVLLSFGDFCQRRHNCRWDYTGGGRAYNKPYRWLDDRFALVTFQSVDDLLPGIDLPSWPFVLSDGRTRPDPERRDFLYSFAGNIDYWYALPRTHIRGGRLKVLQKLTANRTDVFIGETDEAKKRFGDSNAHIYLFQRSVFVLCPAGFGRWTFRQAEAIQYGAIPVFIADG